MNLNFVNFFWCEPTFFGSQKFGSQNSGSQKFGSPKIWNFFMVHIFPKFTNFQWTSEPWFTNYPSALFLLSFLSSSTFLFSLPIKKKEAIYFLIVYFYLLKTWRNIVKKREGGSVNWAHSLSFCSKLFFSSDFHVLNIKLKLWLVMPWVKYKYSIFRLCLL